MATMTQETLSNNVEPTLMNSEPKTSFNSADSHETPAKETKKKVTKKTATKKVKTKEEETIEVASADTKKPVKKTATKKVAEKKVTKKTPVKKTTSKKTTEPKATKSDDGDNKPKKAPVKKKVVKKAAATDVVVENKIIEVEIATLAKKDQTVIAEKPKAEKVKTEKLIVAASNKDAKKTTTETSKEKEQKPEVIKKDNSKSEEATLTASKNTEVKRSMLEVIKEISAKKLAAKEARDKEKLAAKTKAEETKIEEKPTVKEEVKVAGDAKTDAKPLDKTIVNEPIDKQASLSLASATSVAGETVASELPVDKADTKEKNGFFTLGYITKNNRERCMKKGVWLFILNSIVSGLGFTAAMYQSVNSAAFSFYRLTFYDSTFVFFKVMGMCLLLDVLFIGCLTLMSKIVKKKVNVKHLIASQGIVSLYQCVGIIVGFVALNANVYAGAALLMVTLVVGSMYAIYAYTYETKGFDDKTIAVFVVTYLVILSCFLTLLPLIGGTFTRLV